MPETTTMTVDPGLRTMAERYRTSNLPRSITTQREFEEATAAQSEARAVITRAKKYFDVLLAPVREASKRLLEAQGEFVKPLQEFDAAVTTRTRAYIASERARREEETRLARERELDMLRELRDSVPAESDLADTLQETIQQTVIAPLPVAKIVSSTMTTVTRKVMEVVNISELCHWIGTHEDPNVAAAFADDLLATAKRYHKASGVMPAGCVMVDSDSMRRR